MSELLTLSPKGLRSHDGAFYVDAWANAPLNLVTHAHSDHAREGSAEYWCAKATLPIIKHRLGPDVKVRTFAYGKRERVGESWISFHPAGHILGSAQIRIERANSPSDVLVFTGDFKRDPDPTCDEFEVVPCRTFITESTFGLPIYSWKSSRSVAQEILDWWMFNRETGLTSILFCYSLGKAQRALAELAALTDDTVLLHGATDSITKIYREAGVAMCPTRLVADHDGDFRGQLVLAPPSAHRSPWMKKFKDVSTGFASGWMAVRGVRRGRNYERGFVLSDHADWPSLIRTVQETGAEKVYVTHGSKEVLARYLTDEMKISAEALRTEFGDEEEA